MNKLEDILENLNGFGKYQKSRYILLCLSALQPPIASYIHSFIAATPKYSCGDNEKKINFTNNDLTYYSSQTYYQKCRKIIDNATIFNDTNIQEDQFVYCTSWVYDKTYYKKTLTEEFDLVCDKAIWRSFMQAIYYTGMLVGSILLGIIGKKFGLKTTLITSFLLLIIGCFTLSFSPIHLFPKKISFTLLVLGRFLIAIGSHGISINSYLVAMEFIGRNYKKYCALIFEFVFAAGQLVLVLSAYFFREWRDLTLILLVPCLPFFLFICLCDESIQYLSSRKEYDKIEKILQKIAKTNKTKLDENLVKSFLCKENSERKISSTSQNNLKKPSYFFISLISLNWIINNFIFHGLGLRSNDLGISPYASFALSALVELICSIFTFKLLQFKFRRKFYFLFMFFSGVFCTSIFFSNNVILIISSALIAKFCISCTYAIMRKYSSEYFPEYYRKSYLTKFSIMARTGSVTAPFIIALGDYYFKQLPFLIFGISCFLSSFSTLVLPKIAKEKSCPEIKVDNNQQLIQNNWLDGQDIYLDKMDNMEDLEDIELKEMN